MYDALRDPCLKGKFFWIQNFEGQGSSWDNHYFRILTVIPLKNSLWDHKNFNVPFLGQGENYFMPTVMKLCPRSVFFLNVNTKLNCKFSKRQSSRTQKDLDWFVKNRIINHDLLFDLWYAIAKIQVKDFIWSKVDMPIPINDSDLFLRLLIDNFHYFQSWHLQTT